MLPYLNLTIRGLSPAREAISRWLANLVAICREAIEAAKK
jgi:hypothetical protein